MAEEIDLSLLSESFKRVGKRLLEKDELKQFVLNTLQHEIANLKERTVQFNNKQIKEIEINEFEFFNDGYRYGIIIHMIDDNIYNASRKKDGTPVQVKRLYKYGKDGKHLIVNGKKVPTKRLLMRIKSRRGSMGLFIGQNKVNYIDKDKHYVLIGGLQTQWKNKETGNYEDKKKGQEYEDRPNLTLNVWQIANFEKKGKGITLDIPDLNWEKEENGN